MSDRRIVLPPSLDFGGVSSLAEALDAALADRAVRVLMLVGEGKVFCRGLDVEALLATADRELVRGAIAVYQRALLALRRGGKPSVALVDGAAQGGGVGLAAGCSVVIATTSATFALPEALFGLAPAMVLPILFERMTVQRARLLALTPHARSAAEALAIGLCDEVVEPAQAERAVGRWVRWLCRVRPASAECIARIGSTVGTGSLEAALAAGGELTYAAASDSAVMDALQRFRESGRLGEEDE
ncbi:MAG: enoyl-CoA hydratase/isomerase family protein [Polyangiaceae bacterium]|nr:enoyl-CoA hydratase/isomerase family protein [Polyangiaceae bacterium]